MDQTNGNPLGRLLRWLGLAPAYRPSVLDRPPGGQAPPERRDAALDALERLGYLDPLPRREPS